MQTNCSANCFYALEMGDLGVEKWSFLLLSASLHIVNFTQVTEEQQKREKIISHSSFEMPEHLREILSRNLKLHRSPPKRALPTRTKKANC